MHIEVSPDGAMVACPAKLNLFLEVVGRRPDGYHDLETIMETISIHDHLRIRMGGRGIRLTCNAPEVPCDRRNTVWQAARRMIESSGYSGGVEIAIDKRIPSQAGLGGGSSDGAGALVGLDRLLNARTPPSDLLAMAAEIGSDVPFFIHGGTALCRGRGEIIEPLDGCGRRCYVVVAPKISASTAQVYAGLGMPLTTPLRDATISVDLLQNGEVEALNEGLFNRLEQAAVELFPALKRIRQAMESQGFCGVAMSGSGSSYFGICRNAEDAVAKQQALLQSIDGQVYTAHTVIGSEKP